MEENISCLNINSIGLSNIIAAIGCIGTFIIAYLNYRFQKKVAHDEKTSQYNEYFSDIKEILYSFHQAEDDFLRNSHSTFKLIPYGSDARESFKDDEDKIKELKNAYISKAQKLEAIFPGFKEKCLYKEIKEYMDKVSLSVRDAELVVDYIINKIQSDPKSIEKLQKFISYVKNTPQIYLGMHKVFFTHYEIHKMFIREIDVAIKNDDPAWYYILLDRFVNFDNDFTEYNNNRNKIFSNDNYSKVINKFILKI